jgi:hypothetical protein
VIYIPGRVGDETRVNLSADGACFERPSPLSQRRRGMSAGIFNDFQETVSSRAGSRSILRLLLFMAMVPWVALLTGCGTLANGRGWGQDAFTPISGDRLAKAAYRALTDPQVYIPAAGAAVFGCVNTWDNNTAEWAYEHHPIFGSKQNAGDASDVLMRGLLVETAVTAIATPSGKASSSQWWSSKGKGAGVELLALGMTGGVTEIMKSGFHRTRPDGDGNKSFPSGHAAAAVSAATLSNRNLDYIDMPPAARTTLQITDTSLAWLTGWARMEAGKHHPSDVLAGAALARFLTVFIHDGFMNLPEDAKTDVVFYPVENGVGVALVHSF